MDNKIKYFLFIDESGDHGLKNIDPNFPVFVLSGCIFSKEDYPIARFILEPKRINLAFEVINDKIFKKNEKTFGLKIFP